LIFLPEDQGPSIVENAREFTSFENIADPDDVDPEGNPGDGTNHPERRPFIQIYYQGTVSTVELDSKMFSLYPNPVADNNVTLQLENASPAIVEVVNIAGQTVRNFNVEGNKTELDLGGLVEGVYLMHIIQNGQSAVKRIVIH